LEGVAQPGFIIRAQLRWFGFRIPAGGPMQVIKGYPWPVAIAGQYAVAPNRRQKVPLRLKSPGVSIDSIL